MPQRLFGIETEYDFTGLSRFNTSLDRGKLLRQFLILAKRRLPHLPELGGSGLFLQNGSRFYVDHGLHPEMSTPECTNPRDVVRYILAGEQMLVNLTNELESEDAKVSQAILYRCNVDYSGAQTTWGCHESYLHRSDPRILPEQIIPHLVSRLIYTGAGGFNVLSPALEFTLSPRVPHLVSHVSAHSTHGRGIFHTKDEPLCQDGYHRLHILCGESLCSQLSTWLKVGTTALIVAMIDAGARPGAGAELRSPLEAMRTFAADPNCEATVELNDGRRWSALMIQHYYLTQAEQWLHKEFLPPWAEEICRAWRAALDRLPEATESLQSTLDWAIKRALYADRARRQGIAWDSLRVWKDVLAKLVSGLDQTEFGNKPVSVEILLSRRSPVRHERQKLTPLLRQQGLNWDDLNSFLHLRQQLFEIDMRFGQLGDKGIFAALDRAGVLRHQVTGLSDVKQAVSSPPEDGRARVRGEFIQHHQSDRNRYRCDWQRIWDTNTGRVLDLSNPFETEERWQASASKEETLLARLLACP